MLIRQGAAINCVNTSGETPLHYASRLGLLNMVSTLLQLGAGKIQKQETKKIDLFFISQYPTRCTNYGQRWNAARRGTA
jgi:ankyrin repeat protein